METVPINTLESQGVILELIYRLKVKDIMTTDVVFAKPDDTLRTIQTMMSRKRVSGVPILHGKILVGIVSMYDIILALDVGFIEELADKRMTRNVVILEDEMPVSFAIQYFNKYRFGRFPVLNKNLELVGIISPGDILKALLLEINSEVKKLEETLKPAEKSENGYKHLVFRTVKYDFENAGNASSSIKKALKECNIQPDIVRRAAIVCYELEMNQVIHSTGGMIGCKVGNGKIEIEAKDEGPGIPDIELAMKEGYSTAIDWVRSLGFGAGMGLANTKRASDEFHIESTVGLGTTVRSTITYGGGTC